MTFHKHGYFSSVDLDLRNLTKFSLYFSDFSMIFKQIYKFVVLKTKRK